MPNESFIFLFLALAASKLVASIVLRLCVLLVMLVSFLEVLELRL
jgi:hypothetical protein